MRVFSFCVFFAALGVCGCGGPTVLLDVDDDAAGAFGDDGGKGAVLFTKDVRVRGDRVVNVEVVAPAEDGAFPPVLLVQGGFAAVERYRWLAQHIASRGFVVLSPHHVLDLAFFAQGNGRDVLDAARAGGLGDDVALDDEAALAVGHSLGGVVASNAFAEDEGGVSHLVLLSSVPNPSLDLSRTTGRVLTIAGGRDGKISPDEVRDGGDEFACDVVFAEVTDATHYDFTDDASASEVEGDAESVDRDGARHDAQVLIDAMLASQIGDTDGDLLLDDAARWPAGVKP